ncbi:MAG: rod shape-determining protein MreD [Actinobacteria bacterium HGW-Actinobacteria-7]|nr:MAG: rod shape-determining protein MreD [Actinobacteria bacterium HGW-Actinobacteria-7]
MGKLLPAFAAIIAALILQAGVAPYIAIGGVVPSFPLLVVVTLALATGPTEGAAAGFAAGLLFDLLGTGPVGPMCMVLTVVGYAAGLLHEQMFAEGWLLPLTVLAIAALSAELAYGLILAVLGEGGSFWSALVSKMLPAAVYNTSLALLVYPWLARFLRTDRPMKTFKRLA